MLEFDVVIIGSGIAGMTSAIYLRRANINTLIIEGNTPGGQLNKINSVENYPGFTSIEGPTLAYNIYSQVNNLDTEYLFDEVKVIDFKEKKVKTLNKEIKYKYLIIATGRKSKRLNLENEEKLLGNGLSYCALCDGALYKEKEVFVVGKDKLAIEDAKYLSKICKKVTIIFEKDKVNEDEDLIKEVVKDNIDIIYNSKVKEYLIDDNKFKGIILDNNQELLGDGIFLAIGYVSDSQIFDVKKDNNYILVDENYETSIKDVYACGDIIKKDVYQITTAIGEATNVATRIIKKINKK